MESLTKEHIAKIPLFSGVDPDMLLSVLGGCRLRKLEPGEVLYRYGEYGDDCGIVFSGLLSVRSQIKTTEDPYGEVRIGEGNVAGEIAALSGYARTADVVAVKPSEVLIVPKETLLSLFDAFPPVKTAVDDIYRNRVLSFQLRSVPIFMGLGEDVLEKLQGRATLHTYGQGEAVFRQGDDADAFYLVRYGFLKVSESGPDGRKKVLAYLKGGHFFGEMALIKETGRSATVTAIDRSELVRIARNEFLQVLAENARVKASLEKSMQRMEEKNVRIRKDDFMEKTLRTVIDSGFMLSKEILIIDFTRCINCDTCVKACGVLHDNMTRLVRKGIRLNNILLIATSCRHCYDPVCMTKCRTGAINRGADGEIYHADSCIGCGRCAKSCPYGNISLVPLPGSDGAVSGRKNLFSRYLGRAGRAHEDISGETDQRKRRKRIPVKCDMCRDYKFMACVYNCPTGAAKRMDTEKFYSDFLSAG